MALDEKEKMQIAEIVSLVMDRKFSEMQQGIVKGFVECIDWHNDNFAKIMQATNQKTLDHISKSKREVIEIRTKEQELQKAEEQKELEISQRLGFTAKGE